MSIKKLIGMPCNSILKIGSNFPHKKGKVIKSKLVLHQAVLYDYSLGNLNQMGIRSTKL